MARYPRRSTTAATSGHSVHLSRQNRRSDEWALRVQTAVLFLGVTPGRSPAWFLTGVTQEQSLDGAVELVGFERLLMNEHRGVSMIARVQTCKRL